jgi:hypothetical protein
MPPNRNGERRPERVGDYDELVGPGKPAAGNPLYDPVATRVDAPSIAKMSEKGPSRNRSPEPLFKVRQILILFVLVLVFSFAVRLATGDPFPHDIQDFFASTLGLKLR